ncbi:MAG: hypothetical protein CMM93_05965 [Rickettsiales bacterium]|nr:hypothetical protein [Rickettsiales bacterium]|tara:strand:- start:1249 stop:1911 length:663 start_codon:yes stop_codon:yes gene_type:complete
METYYPEKLIPTNHIVSLLEYLGKFPKNIFIRLEYLKINEKPVRMYIIDKTYSFLVEDATLLFAIDSTINEDFPERAVMRMERINMALIGKVDNGIIICAKQYDLITGLNEVADYFGFPMEFNFDNMIYGNPIKTLLENFYFCGSEVDQDIIYQSVTKASGKLLETPQDLINAIEPKNNLIIKEGDHLCYFYGSGGNIYFGLEFIDGSISDYHLVCVVMN